MEMPLNGRQATELIFLSGLATSAPAGDLNTNKNFPTVTISVAGGRPTASPTSWTAGRTTIRSTT
jgi:hypothetical protein